MALIDRSIEMSFSVCRLRSALRSISIGSLLVCALVVGVLIASPGIDRCELDLYLARAELAVAKHAALAIHVQRDSVSARARDAAFYGGSSLAVTRRDKRGHDQAADRPAPVPPLGERAVHARRGDLKGVGLVTHHRGIVECRRQVPADHRDVIEADAAVGV